MAVRTSPNNAVAEWFGHRVYPTVASTPGALADQRERRCPFLSQAIGSHRACIKTQRAAGVCTISSMSNGSRQDWLVCPYRALDGGLVENVTRRLFSVEQGRTCIIRPAMSLARPEAREEVQAVLGSGGAAFVYLQDKLGGEIALSATTRSPELSFDVTLVELVLQHEQPTVGRYGVLEVQTMDFHGSYSNVVKDLDDALRLHGPAFHGMVRENIGWLSNRIEGPNIANVFKRTLYQMLLKFRLAGHGACVGAALAIPAAVWESWQRHLGAPALREAGDGTWRLSPNDDGDEPRAWIYVFDLDAASPDTPNPVVVTKIIGTDVDAVAHYAFKVAPDAVLEEGGSGSLVLDAIRMRLSAWWPELGPPPGTRATRPRRPRRGPGDGRV